MIGGPRREVYASGERSKRLLEWALRKQNPKAAPGTAFREAWDALMADVEKKFMASLARMGFSKRLRSRMSLCQHALIENLVERELEQRAAEAAPPETVGPSVKFTAKKASRRQTPHMDCQRFQGQALFALTQRCEPTLVYTGVYETAADVRSRVKFAEENSQARFWRRHKTTSIYTPRTQIHTHTFARTHK